MSQDYSFKYDQMLGNDPTGKSGVENDQSAYPNAGYARKICFVLPARMISFDYHYLVKADYEIESGMIILSFTTDTVTLKGYQLDNLFFDLMQEKPRLISCTDTRYNQITEKGNPVINEIIISKNSQ